MKRRRHLQRLERVYADLRGPVFFLTCCTHRRVRVLTTNPIPGMLVMSWKEAKDVHGWLVGRYVIMPDHVHFFAAPARDGAKSLGRFVSSWKTWSGNRIRAIAPSFRWQREFFDHLLRSEESYQQKWEYVRANPVRAGLVGSADEWPYQGEANALMW